MNLRVVTFPDGTKTLITAHARYNFATVIDVHGKWQLMHKHLNEATANRASKMIKRFLGEAGRLVSIVEII